MKLSLSSACAAILGAAVVAGGCSSEPTNEEASSSEVIEADARGFELGPNDVTYLFPFLRGSSEDLGLLIGVDEPLSAGGEPWPQRLFDPSQDASVIHAAQHLTELRGHSSIVVTSPITGHAPIDLTPAVTDRASWAIAAFRFDPCAVAPPPADPNACAVELRLVAQPLRTNDGDTAAHLIFRYGTGAEPDTDARDRILTDLVRLAQDARRSAPETGGPLSVHPALVGPDRVAFRQSVKGFLARHLREDALAEVAFFGQTHTQHFAREGGISDIWQFFKGTVRDGASRLDLDPIPNTAQVPNGPQRSQTINFRTSPQVHPAPARAFDLGRVRRGEEGTAQDADCASCHFETMGRPSLDRNLRMLGFFRGQLTIKDRVRAETDTVVQRANAILAR